MKEVGEREETLTRPRSPSRHEEGSQDDHEAIVMLERAFKLNTIRCIVISSILLILVIIGLALGGAALGNTKDISKELRLNIDQKTSEIESLNSENKQLNNEIETLKNQKASLTDLTEKLASFGDTLNVKIDSNAKRLTRHGI